MDIFAPSNFFYNKNNAYPNIQYILQNIYTDIKGTADLNPYVLKGLFNLIKIMDDSSAQFVDAYCDLFKDMIQKLAKAYNFNTIFLVFDSLATFIIASKVIFKNHFLFCQRYRIKILSIYSIKYLLTLCLRTMRKQLRKFTKKYSHNLILLLSATILICYHMLSKFML